MTSNILSNVSLEQLYDNPSLANKFSKNFQTMGNFQQIGNGTYGKVYKGQGIMDNGSSIEIALKIIPFDQERLPIIQKEVMISYRMEELEIGPIIYDAFSFDITTEKTSHVVHKFPVTKLKNPLKHKGAVTKPKSEKPQKTSVQYIVMELLDESVHSFLSKGDKHTFAEEENVIDKIVRCLQLQISDGIFCSDQKPGNFVIKYSSDKNHIVKMIDFGGDFCDTQAHYEIEDKTLEKLIESVSVNNINTHLLKKVLTPKLIDIIEGQHEQFVTWDTDKTLFYMTCLFQLFLFLCNDKYSKLPLTCIKPYFKIIICKENVVVPELKETLKNITNIGRVFKHYLQMESGNIRKSVMEEIQNTITERIESGQPQKTETTKLIRELRTIPEEQFKEHMDNVFKFFDILFP